MWKRPLRIGEVNKNSMTVNGICHCRVGEMGYFHKFIKSSPPLGLVAGLRQTCDKLANSIERVPANLGHAIPIYMGLGRFRRRVTEIGRNFFDAYCMLRLSLSHPR